MADAGLTIPIVSPADKCFGKRNFSSFRDEERSKGEINDESVNANPPEPMFLKKFLLSILCVLVDFKNGCNLKQFIISFHLEVQSLIFFINFSEN